jgi:hypothetical protein
MAGLVPAIHVFASLTKDVDARTKSAHDDQQIGAIKAFFALSTARQVFATLACHARGIGGDGSRKPRVNPSLVNIALASFAGNPSAGG